MKRSFGLTIAVLALLLGLGVYQFCNSILAEAKSMMDDAVGGEVENVEDSLIYQIGDRYSDLYKLSENEGK